MYMYVLVVFFFKQKTAYEMRISDWSSDVCSSDLEFPPHDLRRADPHPGQLRCRSSDGRRLLPPHRRSVKGEGSIMGEPKPLASLSAGLLARKGAARPAMRRQPLGSGPGPLVGTGYDDLGWNDMGSRSEEHTSALQSLMRNSYAVFFLK